MYIIPDPYFDKLNLDHIQSLLLSSDDIIILNYLAEKVHVHRWPQDSPVWDPAMTNRLDQSINKNPDKKHITIKDNTLLIENFTFRSLCNIGVSVPFFKEECTMILEAQFCDLYAHIHITTRSENYIDIFHQLTTWKKNLI